MVRAFDHGSGESFRRLACLPEQQGFDVSRFRDVRVMRIEVVLDPSRLADHRRPLPRAVSLPNGYGSAQDEAEVGQGLRITARPDYSPILDFVNGRRLRF
ncbi:MAG: hypothetical protein K2W96_08425, partial [Gemmataceae bacterium]|nr:hypothetical protein [Gemmataceae bacterium]